MEEGRYNDSYLKKLIPFYLVSILIHALTLGGSFAYSTIMQSGDGFNVTTYETGDPANYSERLFGAPLSGERIVQTSRTRLHRVDYFNTVVFENIVDTNLKPVKPTDIITSITPPTDSIETADTFGATSELDLDSSNSETDSVSQDELLGQILTMDEIMEIGAVPLRFPSYKFEHIPYNPDNYDAFDSSMTYQYDTIYFIVDISKRGGFGRYFEWANFWDFLLSLPGVMDPPTPIGVAIMIEDPYYWTVEVAMDAMRNRIERTEYNIPSNKQHNYIDVDNHILNGLGLEELEKPVAILVDWEGYVWLKLEGNIEEMPLDQARKALSVIKKKWNMNEFETNLGMTAIIAYQQKLQMEKRQSEN